MPVFQSPGIASGIDVNTLVTKLVDAERAPAQIRLDRSDNKIKTQVSALGQLKGSWSALLASLAKLKTEAAFQIHKAESSDKDAFTATATETAAPGSYGIEILAVASAPKLTSGLIAGGSTAVIGSGDLTIAVGAASFTVTIDGTNNTLTGIRDAINAAADNKGVRATIINTTGGAVLTLSGANTGAANALRVTRAGGDGGLDALVYDPGVLTNLTQSVAAADASIKVEGFSATSATNTFANIIDGVTINVAAAEPGTVKTLTISNDNSAAVDNVKKFVQDFNAAVVVMSQLRRYNPTTKDAGPLLGDAMLRGAETTLRGMVADAVAGATAPYDTLSSVGITTQQDGTLKLDETKLNNALNASFGAIGKLFGSVTGIGARMHAYLDTQLKADAPITTRTDSLNNQKRLNDRDRDTLDARMKSVEQRYRKQFSALDTVLAGLQQTSAFLSQRLGSSNS